MKNALALVLIGVALASGAFAAEKGPEIRIVDDKVSIHAEAVPLARLLRLLDLATGMTSKVPPELANRNVSVRFTNLTLDAAVRKIFEGQPLDYVVVQSKSILVTGTSSQLTADNSPPPFNPPPAQENVFVEDNPFLSPQPPNQNPPAMIQTPFGPIANPRANGQMPQQNGNMPMVNPGQPVPQNPFNNTLPGFNGGMAPSGLQTAPQFGYPPQAPGSFPPQAPMNPGIAPQPIPRPQP